MADDFTQVQIAIQAPDLGARTIYDVGLVEDGFVKIINGEKTADAKGNERYYQPKNQEANGFCEGIIAVKMQAAGEHISVGKVALCHLRISFVWGALLKTRY